MKDEDIIRQNHKLLALVEHPVWGAFAKLIEEDMTKLDSISTLVLQGSSREDLAREIEVRYHTIEAIRQYVAIAIEKAELALAEIEETKSDIINIIEP
jgi:hypothetical protein